VIDFSNPAEVEALMVRVQARRIAQAYTGAGKVIPPGAAKILRHDTERAMEADTNAYAAWCASRGVECIEVFGVTDFKPVTALCPTR